MFKTSLACALVAAVSEAQYQNHYSSPYRSGAYPQQHQGYPQQSHGGYYPQSYQHQT